jgi:hypothetical protein
MKNMKKKITTLLATVVMAGALFAGPALARDNDHDGYRNDSWRSAQEWREHHPYQGYGDRRWSYGYGYENQRGRYAYGYPYSGYRGYSDRGWNSFNSGPGWHHDRDHDGD